MGKMKAAVLVAQCKHIAKDLKTLYVMGCFGAPMNATNKARYSNNNEYNRRPERKAMINAATDDTFGFDCVGLIKGILWGFSGDKTKVYGGASYTSNGVPDYGANTMIQVCSGVSTDFSKIKPGEAVWKSGHIGVYIGDGLAVECTPSWGNKVQITAVGNIGSKSGYHTRTWTSHGKLPYVDYTEEAQEQPKPDPAPEPESWDREEIEQIVASVFQNCREQEAFERRDNDAGVWSKTGREWAVEHGIFAGIGPLPDGSPNFAWGDYPTREQLAQILYKYDKMKQAEQAAQEVTLTIE